MTSALGSQFFSVIFSLIFSLIFSATMVFAMPSVSSANDALTSTACRKESLAKFFSLGKEISSNVINSSDPCDGFGGNEAYTPTHSIRVYVNFNLPVKIDLDVIDATFQNRHALQYPSQSYNLDSIPHA